MIQTYLQFQTSAGEDLQTSDNNNFYVAGTVEEGVSLELYKNSAESNRVDKSEYLTLVDIISGNLREATSILSMNLTIEYPKVPDFNYVYISAFDRFYYVTDFVAVTNKLWNISLMVDVLMSFKDKILQCTGFVDRNESTFDPSIVDKRRPIQQGQGIVISQNHTNNVFGADGTYVLAGTGMSVSGAKNVIKFGAGVTVTINGASVSSGDTIPKDATVAITSTRAQTNINSNLVTNKQTLQIDGQCSLYVETGGATVDPYTITIQWVYLDD